MKAQANKGHRDVSFEVGDMVLLKLRPYCHNCLVLGANEKLSPHFYGTFKILEKIGSVAYRLQFHAEAKFHPVFRISQLKRALGSFLFMPPLPPQLEETLKLPVEPEAVLGIPRSSSSHPTVPEILI